MKKRRMDARKVTESALKQFSNAISSLEEANRILESEITEHEKGILSKLDRIERLKVEIELDRGVVETKKELRDGNITRIDNIKNLVGGIC